ncbi:MAG: hypothetical protein QOI63_6, partial [Thermoplasmata archaeon]|nr:hypothetical protein [Thermoplasmata archaeon]
GAEVRLDASGSLPSARFGSPLASYEVDWGDHNVTDGAGIPRPVRASGTDPVLLHNYGHPGTFQVRVVVTDRMGLANVWAASLRVLPAGPASPAPAAEPAPSPPPAGPPQAEPPQPEAMPATGPTNTPAPAAGLAATQTASPTADAAPVRAAPWTRSSVAGLPAAQPAPAALVPIGLGLLAAARLRRHQRTSL